MKKRKKKERKIKLRNLSGIIILCLNIEGTSEIKGDNWDPGILSFRMFCSLKSTTHI